MDSGSAPQFTRSEINSILASSENNYGTHSPESSSKKKNFATFIKQGLKQQAEKSLPGKRKKRPKVMYRVRKDLRDLKPEHYTARAYSFGLFDRSPLDMHKRIAHKWKLVMGNIVLDKFMDRDGARKQRDSHWDQLCQTVVPNPERMQDLYDEGQEPLLAEEVRSILTLDAIFLTCIVGVGSPKFDECFPSLEPAIDSAIPYGVLYRQVVRDVFRIENQIPICLVRTALQVLLEKLGQEVDDAETIQLVEILLTELLGDAVSAMSYTLPGAETSFSAPIENDFFNECDNLLECMYEEMYTGMNDEAEDDEAEEFAFTSLPTATDLRKAGVQFEGRTGQSLNIEFKAGWFKGTLCLPTTDIWDSTEMVWRNLLAYEEVYSEKRNFSNYVFVMDALIESADDVKVLRSGRHPVITGKALGGNEYLASLFNNKLIQNVGVGNRSSRGRSILKKVHAFYHQGQRKMFWEFVQVNFGKPWLTFSVIVATVLIIMTFLQTYYTMADYYQSYWTVYSYYHSH